MSEAEQPITIFYSWQATSDKKTNMNFIEDCLKKAIKAVFKTDGLAIVLDRDTKGVGGTPEIFNTILSKIRTCDIFVCDLTLVYSKPNPSPNPNVLIELGYALSIVGPGRIICVMNTSSGAPNRLPFDMQNKRYPLQYNLLSQTRISSIISKFRGNQGHSPVFSYSIKIRREIRGHHI